jgi:hypothetical protein
VEDARKLAELSADNAVDLFNSACYLSWAVGQLKPKEGDEAERLRDQAVELLVRAFSLGVGKDGSLGDPDFKAIAEHPGFRRLMEQHPPPGK